MCCYFGKLAIQYATATNSYHAMTFALVLCPGGGSDIQGGRGGDGEGPNFASLLHTIDDQIRDRVPYTKLEDVSSIRPSLHIGSDLCLLLQAQGFQTVGGLFETYEIDLVAHFDAGDVSSLKTTLKKFAQLVKTRKI
jgi:hypothetical protein